MERELICGEARSECIRVSEGKGGCLWHQRGL